MKNWQGIRKGGGGGVILQEKTAKKKRGSSGSQKDETAIEKLQCGCMMRKTAPALANCCKNSGRTKAIWACNGGTPGASRGE